MSSSWAVNADNVPGVTLPLDVRVNNVRSISMVNHVVGLDVPAATFIEELKPNVVVKGKEFETRNQSGTGRGGILWRPADFQFGRVRFASTRCWSESIPSIWSGPQAGGFLERHGSQLRGSEIHPEKMAGMRVLVIGDLIIDDYVTCGRGRMSQEDPTIVVTPILTRTFVGGAAASPRMRAVSAPRCNIAPSSGKTNSQNTHFDFAEAPGVRALVISSPTVPGPRPESSASGPSTRLCCGSITSVHHPASPDVQRRMLAAVEAALPKCDLILFFHASTTDACRRTRRDTITAKARAGRRDAGCRQPGLVTDRRRFPIQGHVAALPDGTSKPVWP